ncbi:LysR substrate-binding domain-containing protein [Verrucomicrobia bacterium]|nr:LysR substrate-binding domain-containing protein [Verrucomicrobiota bacterium]
MEFHQLRYFVAAAEELSITRAALREHVSQPALSRQITGLERELGVVLFDRVKKRIHLTDAGRYFLTKARQILCDTETTLQQMNERFGKSGRTIRVGFLSPFLDDTVAPAIKSLRKEMPLIQVALHELSPRAQLDRLRDGELDLAILGNLNDEDRKHFSTTKLSRSRIAAVIPSDSPLASRQRIDLKELRKEEFVSLSNELFPGRREFLRSICLSANFEPEISVECDSLTLVIGAVSVGSGVALLPIHCQKLPHSGCTFVSLKTPSAYAEVMAVSRKGQPDSAISQLLTHLNSASAKTK